MKRPIYAQVKCYKGDKELDHYSLSHALVLCLRAFSNRRLKQGGMQMLLQNQNVLSLPEFDSPSYPSFEGALIFRMIRIYLKCPLYSKDLQFNVISYSFAFTTPVITRIIIVIKYQIVFFLQIYTCSCDCIIQIMHSTIMIGRSGLGGHKLCPKVIRFV